MRQLVWMLILICGFLFVGCKSSSSKKTTRTGPPQSDVEFAKDVFRLMAGGDVAVTDRIDWENLNVADIDVGVTYRNMTSEGARENFRNSFIRSFSSSFKQSGGSADAMTNWREQSKDAAKTIVAADGPNGKTLLLTITHTDGQQNLSVLAIK